MKCKRRYLILLVLFTSCGTTGRIRFYDFDYSKYDVAKELHRVINESPGYAVPDKWKDCNKGDYIFERIYVYFKAGPEELYRIGFTGDSTIWSHSSSSRLALISQFDGHIWKNNSELSSVVVKRITKRFEDEILAKIKYRYSMSD